MKLIFNNEQGANWVLTRSHFLSNSEFYGGVYISPDRTPEEQRKHSDLVKNLKMKIQENPGKFWFIRDGKIQSREHIGHSIYNK